MSTVPVKGNNQPDHCYNCKGYDESNGYSLIIPMMIISLIVGICC